MHHDDSVSCRLPKRVKEILESYADWSYSAVGAVVREAIINYLYKNIDDPKIREELQKENSNA